MTTLAVFTLKDVAKHNTTQDAWIAIDGDVYDVTKFIKFHPGGAFLLAEHAGTDCTEAFFDLHRTEVLGRYQHLKVGRLDSVPADQPRAVAQLIPGTLSKVPHAEAPYLQGWLNPMYNENHVKFRVAVRKWYDENVRPINVKMGAMDQCPPKELFLEMGKSGILAAAMAPSPLLVQTAKALGIPCPGGVEWEKFDLFMEQIMHEENGLAGEPGFADGMHAGYTISAPTLMNYGSKLLQETVLPKVLRGEKRICLAISEPFVGSDVAGLRCRAEKSACGTFFLVNGVKKWISSGLDADYFVTAVRTGKEGHSGISMLLVERTAGLSTKIIKTSYSASAGTAYVVYENVKVPIENILGKENRGFELIMHNFNHERWMIIAGNLGSYRGMLKECVLWATQRKVFGKALITQPVIQAKIAEMTAQIEALSSWLDSVTYQMQNMPYKEQNEKLGGSIALLKYYSTRVGLLVWDHSAQILGGRAITRDGMGQRVERFGRAVKYTAIYGGSEEIMQSLAVKQMMKRMPPRARM